MHIQILEVLYISVSYYHVVSKLEDLLWGG